MPIIVIYLASLHLLSFENERYFVVVSINSVTYFHSHQAENRGRDSRLGVSENVSEIGNWVTAATRGLKLTGRIRSGDSEWRWGGGGFCLSRSQSMDLTRCGQHLRIISRFKVTDSATTFKVRTASARRWGGTVAELVARWTTRPNGLKMT